MRGLSKPLQAGHAAIADAVFGRSWQRTAIAEAARTAGVRFTGLWLEAPVDVMSARVQARSDDASDATVAVLHKQLQQNLESVDWERVDASGNLDAVRRQAEAAVFPQDAPVH